MSWPRKQHEAAPRVLASAYLFLRRQDSELPGTAQEVPKARLTCSSSQDAHLQTIIEVLQSIKASDMTPLLKRIYESPGGSDCLDVLMKYMYDEPLRSTPSLEND